MAYGAVREPVEGTMLTVMTDLSSALTAAAGRLDGSSHALLEKDLAASVARTPDLLPRLREAGVVDSGALGFHVFACGLTLAFCALGDRPAGLALIAERLAGRTAAPVEEIASRIDPAFLARAAKDPSGMRYCMDVIIAPASPPPDGWTARFEAIGASVDAVRREGLIKLHVHCDDPDLVRAEAARLGRVLRAEAEDMTVGFLADGPVPATSATSGAAVRVVGDSSMSLPHDLAASLGVARIENHVNVMGRMVRDADLDPAALFAGMREGKAFTTAQTSAADVRRFIDEQLTPPGRLIYLAVGGAYTGTQHLVCAVVRDHPLGDRVTVLDTRAASGQQGLAVLATARKAAVTDDLAEVEEYARRQIETCREYLVIDSLEYLSRSGRIGKVKAALAGALGLKPVVGHGGSGAVTYAKARSHEAALAEVCRRVAAHPGEGRLLVMLEHTDNAPWLERVRRALEASLDPPAEFVTSPLSATSAVHMGPGTWGVAVTRL